MKIHTDYMRSLMFGLEDALISTTGSLVGVAVGSQNKSVVLLAIMVYVSVEAISMAAGQYLSERTVHQLDHTRDIKHDDNLIIGSLIMFIAYLLGGAIPVLPVVFLPLQSAVPFSIVLSFASLFLLGFLKGRYVQVSAVKSALEMLVIGGLAAGIGIAVGYLLKI